MRWIPTTVLLLGLTLTGAPAWAQARHGHGSHDVRALAKQLERATDELQREAWSHAGPRERRDGRGLRAVNRLEDAADAFYRRARHGRLGPGARAELHALERTLAVAARDLARWPAGRVLHRDVHRVAGLLHALGPACGVPRVAARGPFREPHAAYGARLAWR